MFVCFHLGYILHLHIHPCLYAWFPHSKSHNFIITTGCVSHRLSSWPVPLQSFVLMSFLHDIQTSSCLKPPDPFMLCLCHYKQQPNDSGGGARLGPQIILMGSLQENKQGFFFFFSRREFSFSVLQRSRGIDWDRARSISGGF